MPAPVPGDRDVARHAADLRERLQSVARRGRVSGSAGHTKGKADRKWLFHRFLIPRQAALMATGRAGHAFHSWLSTIWTAAREGRVTEHEPHDQEETTQIRTDDRFRVKVPGPPIPAFETQR